MEILPNSRSIGRFRCWVPFLLTITLPAFLLMGCSTVPATRASPEEPVYINPWVSQEQAAELIAQADFTLEKNPERAEILFLKALDASPNEQEKKAIRTGLIEVNRLMMKGDE